MRQTQSDALSARIDALRTRHAKLETAIEDEQTRPLPNATRLRHLKSQKLMLKDEMAYYDGVMRTLSGFGDGRGTERRA